MVLGIDNGLSGALVALSTIAGLPPVEMISMPVMQVRLRHREVSLAKAKGGKAKGRVKNVMENQVDVVALIARLRSLNPDKIESVWFECCPDHANKVATMKSMAMSAGKILAALEYCGLMDRTHLILSHTWQPVMLGKVARGKTEQAAIAKVAELWPSVDFRRSARCKILDLGFIDAALIAEFGRLNSL